MFEYKGKCEECSAYAKDQKYCARYDIGDVGSGDTCKVGDKKCQVEDILR